MKHMSIEQEFITTGFVVMPSDANHYGNVHGGILMLYADNLAYAAGAKFCRMNVVTAKVSEVNFIHPVRVGDLVTLKACITRVGRSSLDIKVTIEGDRLKIGEYFTVAEASFTMVAVDEEGRPQAIQRP